MRFSQIAAINTIVDIKHAGTINTVKVNKKNIKSVININDTGAPICSGTINDIVTETTDNAESIANKMSNPLFNFIASENGFRDRCFFINIATIVASHTKQDVIITIIAVEEGNDRLGLLIEATANMNTLKMNESILALLLIDSCVCSCVAFSIFLLFLVWWSHTKNDTARCLISIHKSAFAECLCGAVFARRTAYCVSDLYFKDKTI